MSDVKESSWVDVWTVHCDGSAVPNPGRMGLGVVMVDPQGRRHAWSQASHDTGCNNEAELRAVMAALRMLKERQAKRILLHSDNSVLVEQLTVPGCKPVVRLSALFDEARGLLSGFDQAGVRWIPRHRNGEADVLARASLGLVTDAAVPTSSKRCKKKR